jgi:hypothetical protein
MARTTLSVLKKRELYFLPKGPSMHAVKRFLAVVALAVLAVAPAWAAVSAASVEAVQMPAWLERDGRSRPLAVGMEVAHGDVIRTGTGARAFLKLAEGSAVKLGENARLRLFSHSLKPRTAFRGALDVIDGAFRFTTGAIRRVGVREVSIRVGTATAGIRGTDVWGRSTAREDLICLIEGEVDIRHGALSEPVPLSQPMSCFAAPRGGAPKPVAQVSAEQVRQWARETEIEAGDGAARREGRWALRLGRHATESDALAQYDLARQAGFDARIKPFAADGGWNYDVVLGGFRDAADAGVAAARLENATGIAAESVR